MERIRQSFDRQGFANARRCARNGRARHRDHYLRFNEGLTQQHGLFHGGVVAGLVDVACGYAALSSMAADREVLTVEFKIHFLKPAKAEQIIAVGKVIQAGRRPCAKVPFSTQRAHACWRE